MSNDVDEYRSPTKKLLRFFETSRDKWKAKYLGAKHQLKLAQNQVRAVEKSREQWRSKAQQAEQALRELKADSKKNGSPQ